MSKEAKRWSGERCTDIIIGIPVILTALAITAGVYSLKAYLALQQYYLKTTSYTIFVPDNASFHYDRYLNAVFIYITVSLTAGVAISYMVSRALSGREGLKK